MPATAERRCNLTLSRDDWSVFIAMLDRAARVSIDRDVEKWGTVLNLVWKDGVKAGGATNRVCREITVQLSAARFTEAD